MLYSVSQVRAARNQGGNESVTSINHSSGPNYCSYSCHQAFDWRSQLGRNV